MKCIVLNLAVLITNIGEFFFVDIKLASEENKKAFSS